MCRKKRERKEFEWIKAKIICKKALQLVESGKMTTQEYLSMSIEELAQRIDSELSKNNFDDC